MDTTYKMHKMHILQYISVDFPANCDTLNLPVRIDIGFQTKVYNDQFLALY